MKEYKPKKIERPERVADVGSAWKGLESIVEDILEQFGIPRDHALEFGVEKGYSAVALSNFFGKVVGVDHFQGDEHAGYSDSYDKAVEVCDYDNITLVKSSYQDFIENTPICNDCAIDLTHVDIIHNYKETYECGLWCAQNSKITLFHDTESFPEVRRAVEDIAKKTGKEFYNYPRHYGLGIVV